MQKFIILLSIISALSLFGNELSWVDEQVAAIKPPREGISNKEISKLKDPFIFFHIKKQNNNSYNNHQKYIMQYSKPKHKYVAKKIVLEAILNKTVLINGKWYKIGEKVHGYKLQEIKPRSVLLTKGKKQLLLSTSSKNKNLKFNNK